mgnify:CR=1 FL=1
MKIFKLKDISEFIRNGVTIKQNISSKEGIPITRIETISKGVIDFNKLGYADIFELEKYKDWLLRKGDILISHINSEKHLGKSAIFLDNDMNIIHGMNLLCVRAINNKIFPKYLQLFFKTNQYKKQIKKIMKKSVNQASFSVNDFKEILITLPELNVQEKIIKKITILEKILENNKLKLKLLSELNKSLFTTMFGDIKKIFKLYKLSDICDVRDGTHDSPEYITEDKRFPLITSKNLKEDKIDFSEVNYISEIDFNKINVRSKVDIGDILMPMIGTIGNPIIVKTERAFSIKNLALIKFNNSQVINIFLKSLLLSDYFNSIITQKNKGGTQKFLSLGDIRNFLIPVPPIELQNKFAERIEKIEKLKFTIWKTISKFSKILKKRS